MQRSFFGVILITACTGATAVATRPAHPESQEQTTLSDDTEVCEPRGDVIERVPRVFQGEQYIEVRSPHRMYTIAVAAAPPACVSTPRVAIDLPSAGSMTATIVQNHAFVAVDAWPAGGPAQIYTWDIDLSTGNIRRASLPGELLPRALAYRGSLFLTTFVNGQGTFFHASGVNAALNGPRRDIRMVRGLLEGPDGSLLVWHDHAMTEAGDPAATLTRFRPGGNVESTSPHLHGAILGVQAFEERVLLWRTPLYGHRGDMTTVHWLGAGLIVERDEAVDERVSFARCPYYNGARVVCENGDTWLMDGPRPDAAFGSHVLAATEGAFPVAARLDSESREVVVEALGGPIARFPIEQTSVPGIALGADATNFVVAWAEQDEHREVRRFLVHTIACPSSG